MISIQGKLSDLYHLRVFEKQSDTKVTVYNVFVTLQTLLNPQQKKINVSYVDQNAVFTNYAQPLRKEIDLADFVTKENDLADLVTQFDVDECQIFRVGSSSLYTQVKVIQKTTLSVEIEDSYFQAKNLRYIRIQSEGDVGFEEYMEVDPLQQSFVNDNDKIWIIRHSKNEYFKPCFFEYKHFYAGDTPTYDKEGNFTGYAHGVGNKPSYYCQYVPANFIIQENTGYCCVYQKKSLELNGVSNDDLWYPDWFLYSTEHYWSWSWSCNHGSASDSQLNYRFDDPYPNSVQHDNINVLTYSSINVLFVSGQAAGLCSWQLQSSWVNPPTISNADCYIDFKDDSLSSYNIPIITDTQNNYPFNSLSSYSNSSCYSLASPFDTGCHTVWNLCYDNVALDISYHHHEKNSGSYINPIYVNFGRNLGQIYDEVQTYGKCILQECKLSGKSDSLASSSSFYNFYMHNGKTYRTQISNIRLDLCRIKNVDYINSLIITNAQISRLDVNKLEQLNSVMIDNTQFLQNGDVYLGYAKIYDIDYIENIQFKRDVFLQNCTINNVDNISDFNIFDTQFSSSLGVLSNKSIENASITGSTSAYSLDILSNQQIGDLLIDEVTCTNKCNISQSDKINTLTIQNTFMDSLDILSNSQIDTLLIDEVTCTNQCNISQRDISKSDKINTLTIRNTSMDSLDILSNSWIGDLLIDETDLFNNDVICFRQGNIKNNDKINTLTVQNTFMDSLDVLSNQQIETLLIDEIICTEQCNISKSNKIDKLFVEDSSIDLLGISSNISIGSSTIIRNTLTDSIDMFSNDQIGTLLIDRVTCSQNCDISQSDKINTLTIRSTSAYSIDMFSNDQIGDLLIDEVTCTNKCDISQSDKINTFTIQNTSADSLNILSNGQISDLLIDKVTCSQNCNISKRNKIDNLLVRDSLIGLFGISSNMSIGSASLIEVEVTDSLDTLSNVWIGDLLIDQVTCTNKCNVSQSGKINIFTIQNTSMDSFDVLSNIQIGDLLIDKVTCTNKCDISQSNKINTLTIQNTTMDALDILSNVQIGTLLIDETNLFDNNVICFRLCDIKDNDKIGSATILNSKFYLLYIEDNGSATYGNSNGDAEQVFAIGSISLKNVVCLQQCGIKRTKGVGVVTFINSQFDVVYLEDNDVKKFHIIDSVFFVIYNTDNNISGDFIFIRDRILSDCLYLQNSRYSTLKIYSCYCNFINVVDNDYIGYFYINTFSDIKQLFFSGNNCKTFKVVETSDVDNKMYPKNICITKSNVCFCYINNVSFCSSLNKKNDKIIYNVQMDNNVLGIVQVGQDTIVNRCQMHKNKIYHASLIDIYQVYFKENQFFKFQVDNSAIIQVMQNIGGYQILNQFKIFNDGDYVEEKNKDDYNLKLNIADIDYYVIDEADNFNLKIQNFKSPVIRYSANNIDRVVILNSKIHSFSTDASTFIGLMLQNNIHMKNILLKDSNIVNLVIDSCALQDLVIDQNFQGIEKVTVQNNVKRSQVIDLPTGLDLFLQNGDSFYKFEVNEDIGLKWLQLHNCTQRDLNLNLKNMEHFDIYNNKFSNLDFDKFPKNIKYFNIGKNIHIKNILLQSNRTDDFYENDFSNCEKLQYVNISDSDLQFFYCTNNYLKQFYADNCVYLQRIYLNDDQITIFDLKNVPVLNHVQIQNQHYIIDNYNKADEIVKTLQRFSCPNANIEYLLLQKNDNLHYVNVENNNVGFLNLLDCTELYTFICSNNRNVSFKIPYSHLVTLQCSNCCVEYLLPLGAKNLQRVIANNNLIKDISFEDCENCKYIDLTHNFIDNFDTAKLIDATILLNKNPLKLINSEKQNDIKFDSVINYSASNSDLNLPQYNHITHLSVDYNKTDFEDIVISDRNIKQLQLTNKKGNILIRDSQLQRVVLYNCTAQSVDLRCNKLNSVHLYNCSIEKIFLSYNNIVNFKCKNLTDFNFMQIANAFADEKYFISAMQQLLQDGCSQFVIDAVSIKILPQCILPKDLLKRFYQNNCSFIF